jgi:hypothetical protein
MERVLVMSAEKRMCRIFVFLLYLTRHTYLYHMYLGKLAARAVRIARGVNVSDMSCVPIQIYFKKKSLI